MSEPQRSSRGQWTALTAAILGWLFDGFEMGLFPLVARPALADLLGSSVTEGEIGKWNGVITAGFLVGAATGGVLFGWLGDRMGRVRAMALSILTYALFSGLCGLANSATMLLILRYIASLGMGGEWSLGVSLVMEIWPAKSRGWLAGVIGAASNVGFVLVGLIALGLSSVQESLHSLLVSMSLPETWITTLTSNGGWRIMMLCGALPALLTFFIRMFVPESERWLEEHSKGATRHWATVDLIGVLLGSLGPLGMIYLWAGEHSTVLRVVGSIIGLVIAVIGFTYPVTRYLKRMAPEGVIRGVGGRSVLSLMGMGALLSGIALLGTWGSMQWAAPWAGKLMEDASPEARANAMAYTQIVIGLGAVVGTVAAALMGHRFGRRITYAGMCVLSLIAALAFYQTNTEFGARFLILGFVANAFTASFYGWLPLYLPELFPTKVRATGQGFAFNFGRILAAVGALQTGALMNQVFNGSYPQACSIMSCIYLLGVVAIWFVPETKNEEFLN